MKPRLRVHSVLCHCTDFIVNWSL